VNHWLAKEALRLAEKATPGPWFAVGEPWGDGCWINAGSEDPHHGRPVCDFVYPDETDETDPPRQLVDAALVAFAREALPALAERCLALEEFQARVLALEGVAQAAQQLAGAEDLSYLSGGDELNQALAALAAKEPA
jgi:hypothetical protein